MWKEAEDKRQADYKLALELYHAGLAQQQREQQEPPREFAPPPPSQPSPSSRPSGFGPAPSVPTSSLPPSKLTILTLDENKELHRMLSEFSLKKESISGMTDWILARADRAELIFQSLRMEMEEVREYEKKLARLYLIDSILRTELRNSKHDCTDTLRSVLPSLVGPCCRGLDKEQLEKIRSLFDIWEKKNYYSPEFISRLRDILTTANYDSGFSGGRASSGFSDAGGRGRQSSGFSDSGGVSDFLSGIRDRVTAEQERSHSHSHSHSSHSHSHSHSHHDDRDRSHERSRDRDHEDSAPHRKRSRFDS